VLRKLRSNLTYANVMATMAVFIALGGSSYAAIKVTSKNVPKDALTGADIKNLTGKDVKNNSLTGADVKNLGAGDFKGGALPAGPQGLQGLKGDPGATDVVVRTANDNDGSTTVQCHPGEAVTGGGAVTSGGTDPEITGDHPSNYTEGNPATGWGAEATGTSITVYVLCARP
jgi:hypothetical protein